MTNDLITVTWGDYSITCDKLSDFATLVESYQTHKAGYGQHLPPWWFSTMEAAITLAFSQAQQLADVRKRMGEGEGLLTAISEENWYCEICGWPGGYERKNTSSARVEHDEVLRAFLTHPAPSDPQGEADSVHQLHETETIPDGESGQGAAETPPVIRYAWRCPNCCHTNEMRDTTCRQCGLPNTAQPQDSALPGKTGEVERVERVIDGEGLVYLASPYTDPDPVLMGMRHQQACVAAAALMRKGVMAFSPIAHSHPIACHGELPTGWDWWKRYDSLYLQACSRMIVLQLAGWGQSKGVQDEIRMMAEMGKPVEYMTMRDALAALDAREGAKRAGEQDTRGEME